MCLWHFLIKTCLLLFILVNSVDTVETFEIFLLDLHCLPIYWYLEWTGLIACYYFIDCASNTQPAGYTNMGNTKYGESATADCDTGSSYSGTAVLAAGACKADGTWDVSKFSGCTTGGKNLVCLISSLCLKYFYYRGKRKNKEIIILK